MLEVTFTIRLTLRGPILTQATAIGAIGIDAPMARDSAGQYYLSFSLVRGRLRQSWVELNEATADALPAQGEIDDLLGPSSEKITDREPQRGRLLFSDFRHKGNSEQSGILHRIRIDSARGAAVKGALQVIESPFAAGQHVPFTGTISFRVSTAAEADRIRSLLVSGLRWTANFGAERTVGFGRLVNVEVLGEDRQLIDVTPAPVSASGAAVLHLAIRPLAPFCIAKRRVSPNLFESDTILSGGVLRGALATTLKSQCGLARDAAIDANVPSPWQELGAHFNHIRFTHAFPAPEYVKRVLYRPVVAPLSLVKDAAGNLYDVALCERPGLIGTPLRAPSFAVDWKESDDVAASFGWAAPGRELRVRTAIDRTRRRAEDEKLFAYDMVVPTGCLWYGTVDLRQVPAGPARAAVETQLRTLLSRGLWSIGKTKAAAEVDILPSIDPHYPSTLDLIDNLWVVILQTPALLCDSAPLNEESGGEELFAAYDAVWQEMSGGTLRLRRFFASQSLAGGYLSLRFQPGKPYNPFLLTDAGSVFVLQATGDIPPAQAVIKDWLDNGLPLPQWAKGRYGERWSTCPFLPADGFGEIAVNLPCHTEKQPPPEVFHAV